MNSKHSITLLFLQTYVGTVATLVCCYEAMLERHMLPDWGFDWPGLAVSTTGVQTTTSKVITCVTSGYSGCGLAAMY